MIYLTLLARRPGRPQPAIGWSCVGSTPGGRSLSDERRLGEGAKARVSESCPDAPRSTRRAEASGERVLRMGLAAVAQQLGRERTDCGPVACGRGSGPRLA